MKNIINVSLVATSMFLSAAVNANADVSVIPQPAKIKVAKSKCDLNKISAIYYTGEENKKYAEVLVDLLDKVVDIELEAKEGKADSPNAIQLGIDKKLAEHNYTISISAEGADLKAADGATLAQSIATLIQLAGGNGETAYLPVASIKDKPDYKWRSVMLDLARRWHPIESLKEVLELMHLYKLDQLHLHLSDNESFTFGTELFPKVLSNNADGSPRYYTKDQLRELVAYADARGIKIIPEIDIPGHSGRMTGGHPEAFGALDENGNPIGVGIVNMASEKAYESLELLFAEILEVFNTTDYFHLGGDEVWLGGIQNAPTYKEFCKENNLDAALNGDASELYAYFLTRMDGVIKKLGKKSLLWEGFHGTGGGKVVIPKDIPIMVWTASYNPPANLAKNGYTLINTTWEPCYICDAMNFAPEASEGLGWKHNHFSNVNNANLQKTDENINVIGGQLTVWEQQYNTLTAYLYDRMPALAERWWDYKSTCSYADFDKKLKKVDKIANKITRPVSIESKGTLRKGGSRFLDKVEVTLKSTEEGEIRYSILDNWDIPAKDELVYDGTPITIDATKVLSAQLYDENGKKVANARQALYQKIDPIFEYTAYTGAPITGWKEMPNFKKLDIHSKGMFGRIDSPRHTQIQRNVFYGIEKKGHIDTRPYQLYNPFALVLKGKMEIKKAGKYAFTAQNQDGLVNVKIGKNSFKGEKKGFDKEEFEFNLKAGVYPVEIEYYYGEIQNVLNIKYVDPESGETCAFEDLMLSIEKK